MDNELLDSLAQKKIVILGFGVEGQAVLDYLRSKKIENVLVFDENIASKDVDNHAEIKFLKG